MLTNRLGVKISRHYKSKFNAGKNCPLKKQVVFSAKENEKIKGFSSDPVGDKNAEIESGILQKYKGRLLVLASDECAVHCRFCFRRNLANKKNSDLPNKLYKILQKDKTIKEVILSGGDPLMLSYGELKALFKAVPKNVIIRIHSRVPVAMPEKFTQTLLHLFKQFGKRIVFVVHANHPNELDNKSEIIFNNLAKSGVKLLNQSVLLKGVNDNANTLANLSEKLFSQGVLPYYLHQLDRAQGTAHFEVPLKQANAIFAELKELLPGYLVPRFVKESKFAKSKIWI